MNFSVRDDGIYMFNVKKKIMPVMHKSYQKSFEEFLFFSNVFSSTMSLAEKELVSG